MKRYGREQQRRHTFWFRSGGTGDRNGEGIDRDDTDEEGGENNFGEHDDGSVVRKNR